MNEKGPLFAHFQLYCFIDVLGFIAPLMHIISIKPKLTQICENSSFRKYKFTQKKRSNKEKWKYQQGESRNPLFGIKSPLKSYLCRHLGRNTKSWQFIPTNPWFATHPKHLLINTNTTNLCEKHQVSSFGRVENFPGP